MKSIRSVILLAGALFAPSRFTTANAAAETASAEDVEALKARIAELEKQAGEKSGVPADPLGLGGMQLPKGVTEKDVLWRKHAGLNLKQAVAAALAQVRHIAKRAKEVAEAKTPAKKTA